MADNKLYDLLGVSRNASENEIRKAYKKLAKELHPDKNPNAGDKFKEVSFAHDVLTDANKREVYNRFGMKGIQEGSDNSDMFAPDDFFNSLFNGRIFGNRRRGRQKGDDTIHQLKVTLEQLYNGHVSKLQLTRNILCKTCNGLGGKKGSTNKCSSCRGTGVKVTYRQIGPGMMQQIQAVCSDCSGQGETINESDKCKTCNGKKVERNTKIIEVNIDKGMTDNQKIVFRGEGDHSPDIDVPGDLIVVLQLKEHEVYSRIRDDLYLEHTITLTEALCGFVFSIKHLDGRDIIIKSVPGQVISPKAVKELKGEGMPIYRSPFEKGDMFIKFNVVFPEQYFAPEEKIIELNGLLPPKVEEKFDLESETVEEVNLHDCDLSQEKMNGSRGGEAYDEDEAHHGPGYTCATQ